MIDRSLFRGATLSVLSCTLVQGLFSSLAFAGTPVAVAAFGSNPGNLRMYEYVPAGLPASAPLVVGLHGCGESASSFAAVSGWIELADANHFALALPEQQDANNSQTCFN